MLALQQVLEIKQSILGYLRATYSFQDKRVQKAFFQFVEDPIDGVFKGPYVSLKLPFVQATAEETAGIPLTTYQLRIMDLIAEDPSISIALLSEALQVSRTTIDKHVAQLKELELLGREGDARTGQWIILL